MSDNPTTELFYLDDDGHYVQIEPKTIAEAVKDKTNNDSVQQFIDDGVTDWSLIGEQNKQYPSARLVKESLNDLDQQIEELKLVEPFVYKGTWVATGQTDFSSIEIPVKAGYAYRVIGETIITEIDEGDEVSRKFQDGDLIIINRTILNKSSDSIKLKDVILLLGYGNEQTKISRFVLDSVENREQMLHYNKVPELQLNSVMIVANDEKHKNLLSFYEYILGIDWDISFNTYQEMIDYDMGIKVEGYEFDVNKTEHLVTLNKYTGELVNVPVPVVIAGGEDVNIARVVTDEQHNNETTYYRYIRDEERWEWIEELEPNWVYMFSRKDGSSEGVFKVKGSVPTFNDLPTSDREIGDVYNVLDTGANYVWTEDGWDKLSETFDLEDYYTKEETYSKQEVIELLSESISEIRTTLVNDYYDKTDINNIVNTITNNITQIDNSVTLIESNIVNIQSDVSNIQTNVATIESNIVNIQSDVSNIHGNIETIESNIVNIQSDVSNVESDLNNNYYDKAEVDSLIQHIGDGLPSQTGHAGEFLTTNGTDASWTNIPSTLPDQTGHNGHQLFTDGTNAYWNAPIPSVIWKKWDRE